MSPDTRSTRLRPPYDSPLLARCAIVVCVLLMIVLRIAWLDSDAYPRLSWSSALLTDEGFYIHNARNLVLFGHERLDGWNNALIMPLLHVVQVAVFRLFGVGSLQARAISVVCGLLSIVLFRDALRRGYGPLAANIGALFLGLDHFYLLYNRLGLMDTPCALFLVSGFWAAVRGMELSQPLCAADGGSTRRTGLIWYVVSGVIFGAAYAVRGMAALVWWLPFLFCFAGIAEHSEPLRKRAVSENLAACAAGLIGALLLYGLLWWLPHRRELAYVNHYYVSHQLIPHSLHRLGENVQISVVHWQRGLFPYLLRHAPIQFGLAGLYVGALLASFRRDRRAGQRHLDRTDPGIVRTRVIGSALTGWMLVFWLFCSAVNYSPSRYYVLFYPAMCGLAAMSLTQIAARSSRTAVSAALMTIWAVINVCWLTDWITHLTYRQQSADRWLASHLPPDSVLLGAVAPGLCMNNRFRVVNVIQDLCNDREPVEAVGDAPAYILILDDRWQEVWWRRHYPDLVKSHRRLHAFPQMLRPFFVIGLFAGNDRGERQFKELQSLQWGK